MTLRLIAEAADAGARLDAFVASRANGLTRSQAARYIDEGRVSVDGKPAAKSCRLTGSETVTVEVPEVRETAVAPQDIPLDVVYEDGDVIVVNKPAGLVVHPAAGHADDTLVNGLLYALGDDLSGINGELRPGIVHRIDKDTSGLLVIAKTEKAKTHLGLQFFNKTSDRKYVAVCWGNLEDETGTITGHIGRNLTNRKVMACFPDGSHGKHAVTHYRVLERLGYVNVVECILETGRTHQIRAHFKYIKHPLFNDKEYGGNEILKGTTFARYKQFVNNCFEICPRQALHAKTLGFEHPTTGERLSFDSEIPDDMQQLIQKWRAYIQSREE